MSTIEAAYPFVEVNITQPPPPAVQRAPGVLAIVGKAGKGPNATPTVIEESADIARVFRSGSTETDLTRALAIAREQDPRPSTIYAVRVDETGATPDWAGALASLNGLDDVTFVVLANTPANQGSAEISALKSHVEQLSSDGNKQMAVAMVDTSSSASPSTVATNLAGFQSAGGRMILVAARGAMRDEGGTLIPADVGVAAAAAIAGYAPQISIALKSVSGFLIPREKRYSAAEIKALSKAGITPIIDPALMSGAGLYFADARTFDSSGKPFNIFVDGVRVLDDVEFKLKAGLIGNIGDARITKAGMTLVKARMEGILEGLVRDAEIDTYDVSIPVLDVLNMPESTRNTADTNLVTKARNNRAVDAYVTIFYGPAVHRLIVTLNPKM